MKGTFTYLSRKKFPKFIELKKKKTHLVGKETEDRVDFNLEFPGHSNYKVIHNLETSAQILSFCY